MKHNRTIAWMMACCLMMVATSCQKEDQRETIIIKAQMGSFGDSKVIMDNLSPLWEVGDSVCVNERIDTTGAFIPHITNVYGETADLEVLTSATYKAVYPYDMVTHAKGYRFDLNLPRTQIYTVTSDGNQRVKAPLGAYNGRAMYGDSTNHNGLSLLFNPMGALLRIDIENDMTQSDLTLTVDSISVTADNQALWGSAVVSNIKSNPIYEVTSDVATHNTVVLAGPNESSMGVEIAYNATQYAYVYVPAVAGTHFTIQIFAHDPDNYYVFSKTQTGGAGYTLNAGDMPTVSYDADATSCISTVEVPYGAVRGLFTVDANGKQIYFSKGNLQYQASTGTWRMAPTQYSFIGNAAGNNTSAQGSSGDANKPEVSATMAARSSQDAWIDLYCFGANGQTATNPFYPYGFDFYYPRPTPTSAGTTTDPYNLTTQGQDWGYNTISNANNNADWYTLSKDEWGYVLNTRPNASYLRKAVTVNGVSGLLLMPDSWYRLLSSKGGGQPSGEYCWPSSVANMTSNTTFSETDWRKMETAGAVFLPQAGYMTVPQTETNNSVLRFNNSISVTTSPAYYWSSTLDLTVKAEYKNDQWKYTYTPAFWYATFKIENNGNLKDVQTASANANSAVLYSVRLVTNAASNNTSSSK